MSEDATAQAEAIERFMEGWLNGQPLPENLGEAIRYALLGGGKRLRPVLAMQCCRAVGGRAEDAFGSACAVEMIHAFSLVHDDLPALDDDEMRRGKPTVHKKYGEAMAILVGDGLMSMAFQVLTDRYEPGLAGTLCGELARGSTAMIAGQVLDTLGGFEGGLSDLERLERVHHNKTGALIRASCRMGAIVGLGGAGQRSPDALEAITRYAEAIGLMFQIVDDVLDVTQTQEHTGKKTGKDYDAGKLTYPGVLGVSESQAEVLRLHAAARAEIERFGPASAPLGELCDFLAVRTK